MIYFPGVSAPLLPADIRLLRAMYYESSIDKHKSEKFFQYMEGVTLGKNAVLLGYKAIAYLMQAKHAENPYRKFSLFSKGKNMLEYAVSIAPDNAELRFLRFCIQTNVPFFLGYSQNIEDDRHIILQRWRTLQDDDLKQKIKEFMLHSEYCSDAEKNMFE